MIVQKRHLTVLAVLASGLATATLVACDADDDVPIIVAAVDSGIKPVPVVDSGVVDAAGDTGDTGADAQTEAAAPDAGTDSAADAKND